MNSEGNIRYLMAGDEIRPDEVRLTPDQARHYGMLPIEERRKVWEELAFAELNPEPIPEIGRRERRQASRGRSRFEAQLATAAR